MDGDVDVLVDVHPSPAALAASVKHSDKKLSGGGGQQSLHVSTLDTNLHKDT